MFQKYVNLYEDKGSEKEQIFYDTLLVKTNYSPIL